MKHIFSLMWEICQTHDEHGRHVSQQLENSLMVTDTF